MFKKRLIILILLLVTATNSVPAWDDTGHMIVSYIAYANLKPAVKQKVNGLVLPAAAHGNRSWVEFCRKGYNPVTIANWMDDLRDAAKPAPFAEWHYINFSPVFAGDFPANIPKDKIGPADVNVLTQIRWAAEQLQRGRAFNTTTQTRDDEASAYALAYLFHLVGDVHQPLHCATRYSAEHPNGDFGGNLFDIKYPQAYNTLHGFWDGAGGLFNFVTVVRPANNSIPTELTQFANSVTTEFPISNTEWKSSMQPEDWVRESNDIARNFAFNPSEIRDDKDKAPSQNYIKKTKETAKKRLAFAGYRLAEVVNRIYSAP